MKVLMSIKPEFAERIFNGEKEFEFRKRVFKWDVKTVVVYASYPICKLIGEFEVGGILSGDPQFIWSSTCGGSGISNESFFDYFSDRKIGHAIKIRRATRYPEPLDLKSRYGIDRPPQSFQYLKS